LKTTRFQQAISFARTMEQQRDTKERELQAVTAQLAQADSNTSGLESALRQEQEASSALRTALATTEARISELSTKVAMAGKLQGLTEDNLMKAHERNDDLRRQFAEAQAASKNNAEDLAEFEAACKLVEHYPLLMKLPQVISDILKRLADAEKERDELKVNSVGADMHAANMIDERDKTLAELSHLQAEIKEVISHWQKFYIARLEDCDRWIEWCRKQNDTHGMNFHQGMRSGLVNHDIAIIKLKDAARIQPKP
jgi:chromosome segregation ATPase